MSRRVRVLIVDDHAAVLGALAGLLETVGDLEVVGEAADGGEALELVSQLVPDVVLMDYDMPRMSGAETTRRLLAQFPEIRVVGLSMHGTEFGGQMRDAGAITTVAKGVDLDVLVEAIGMALEYPVGKPR